MITVKIIYKDGSSDIKDVLSFDEICLDNVVEFYPIRDERKAA